jgi:GNAT superfamily N-acetyltransferase
VSVDLREAGPDDVESLFAIQRAGSLAALAHIFPPDRFEFPDEPVRARWRRVVADPDRSVLVAERDGRAVGLVAFGEGSLDALYVVPGEWGSGIGSALHDAAVASLRASSPEARLWVLEENHRARRFYERRSWRLDGRERVVPFPPHPLDVGYTLALR